MLLKPPKTDKEYLDCLHEVLMKLPENKSFLFWQKKVLLFKIKHPSWKDCLSGEEYCSSECQPTTIEDLEKLLIEVLESDN